MGTKYCKNENIIRIKIRENNKMRESKNIVGTKYCKNKKDVRVKIL